MELLHASPAPYLLTSVMLQEGLRDKGEVVSSTTTGTSTKPVLGSGYGSGDESDGTASTATLFEEEGADTDFDLDMYRCRAGSDPYPLRQPIGGPITPISAARGSKVFEFNFETRPLPALPIGELAGVQLAAVGNPTPKIVIPRLTLSRQSLIKKGEKTATPRSDGRTKQAKTEGRSNLEFDSMNLSTPLLKAVSSRNVVDQCKLVDVDARGGAERDRKRKRKREDFAASDARNKTADAYSAKGPKLTKKEVVRMRQIRDVFRAFLGGKGVSETAVEAGLTRRQVTEVLRTHSRKGTKSAETVTGPSGKRLNAFFMTCGAKAAEGAGAERTATAAEGAATRVAARASSKTSSKRMTPADFFRLFQVCNRCTTAKRKVFNDANALPVIVRTMPSEFEGERVRGCEHFQWRWCAGSSNPKCRGTNRHDSCPKYLANCTYWKHKLMPGDLEDPNRSRRKARRSGGAISESRSTPPALKVAKADAARKAKLAMTSGTDEAEAVLVALNTL